MDNLQNKKLIPTDRNRIQQNWKWLLPSTCIFLRKNPALLYTTFINFLWIPILSEGNGAEWNKIENNPAPMLRFTPLRLVCLKFLFHTAPGKNPYLYLSPERRKRIQDEIRMKQNWKPPCSSISLRSISFCGFEIHLFIQISSNTILNIGIHTFERRQFKWVYEFN